MNDHLSDQEFVSYIHSTLTDIQRRAMDDHLTTCPRCRAGLSDHQALQQRLQREIKMSLKTAYPSSQMTLAAIAPRLKRPGPVVLAWGKAQAIFSGAAALAALVALAVILVALFEGINRSPAESGSATMPQPPALAMGAVYTASLGGDQLPPTFAHEPHDFGDQIRLAGYSLSTAQPLPGTILTVTLVWQAQRKPITSYIVFIHLLDSANRLVASRDGLPANGARPTTGWRVGESITDSHVLLLPADLAAGDYELEVGLYDASTLAQLDSAPLHISVLLTTTAQTEPGGQVRLMGYDLSAARLAPGAIFTVTLHWQTLHKMVNDYSIFVHLFDSANRLVAAYDAPTPVRGIRPTTEWLPGERITDSHTLVLPANLAAGDYELSVGLYDPITGARQGESTLLNRSITIVP